MYSWIQVSKSSLLLQKPRSGLIYLTLEPTEAPESSKGKGKATKSSKDKGKAPETSKKGEASSSTSKPPGKPLFLWEII